MSKPAAPARPAAQGVRTRPVLPPVATARASAADHVAPAWITPRRLPGQKGIPVPPPRRGSRPDGIDVQDPPRARSSAGRSNPSQYISPRRKSDLGPSPKSGGIVQLVHTKARRISNSSQDGDVVGAVSHQIIEEEDDIADGFLDVPSYVEKRKVVILESEPILVLEKKPIPRFGKAKKTSLQTLRSAEAKLAAEAIMQSRDPGQKPRYAKTDSSRTKGRGYRPLIEVMEVDGASLLGVPGTSQVQQFSTYVHNGRQKQIVIAMHEDKPRRMQGGAVATESDSAVMRSGVAELSKQLVTLRESLRESREAHNAFNELSKYHTSI